MKLLEIFNKYPEKISDAHKYLQWDYTNNKSKLKQFNDIVVEVRKKSSGEILSVKFELVDFINNRSISIVEIKKRFDVHSNPIEKDIYCHFAYSPWTEDEIYDYFVRPFLREEKLNLLVE